MSPHNGSICPTFVLKHASVTDMGMRRTNNQDAMAVIVTDDVATWASRGHLLMVADGMGAHAAGELASKLAVDNIPHTYFKLRDLYPPAALRQAIRDANTAIHNKGQSSIGFQGMGTTCSCLVLLPQGALVAHIGDSRVYRLHGQVLEQLTFDHSLVWEMAAAGQMAQEDVPAYIPKNVITRSLGPHSTVHVDLEGPYNAAPGDVFLLCSDGLSGPISDEELGAILQCLPPDEAVETLVDLANLRGGPDNVTCLVVRVTEELSPRTAEAEQPAERTEEDKLPPPPPPIHPIVWGLTFTALVCGLIFAAMEQWIGAGIAGAVMIVGVAFMLVRGWGGTTREGGSDQRAFGRGPYRSYDCRPNADAVSSLTDLWAELKITAIENGWDIAWGEIDELARSAHQARQEGDYCTAIVKHAAAARRLMKQIRQQRRSPLTDSRIGL